MSMYFFVPLWKNVSFQTRAHVDSVENRPSCRLRVSIRHLLTGLLIGWRVSLFRCEVTVGCEFPLADKYFRGSVFLRNLHLLESFVSNRNFVQVCPFIQENAILFFFPSKFRQIQSIEHRLMKAILLVVVAFLSVCLALQAPDLPGPAANPTELRAGSLIIPMDNWQLKYASGGEMSLKPFGLIVRMLYAAKAPILWVIKAGKAADSDDFNAVTTTSTVGSLSFGNQASRPYSAGPFVVPGEYADDIIAFLKNQLPADAKAGAVCDAGFYSQVVIHRTVANITVDVRHKLLFKPHPAISNLSKSFGQTHYGLLASRSRTTCNSRDGKDTSDSAGLDLNTHYEIIQTEDDMLAITGETCFTTVTEPHWAWAKGYAPKYYNAMSNFVVSGGNILCECAGLWSYENYQNGAAGGTGGFLTQFGLQYEQVSTADTLHHQADLPISQWNGKFSGSLYGHTPDWYLQFGTGRTTEDWANNAFVVVENIKPHDKDRGSYIASAGKLSNLTIGSMVFYLGSHSYVPQGSNTLAGRRFYFNGLLTPPHRPARCGFNVCPRDEIIDCSTLNPPVTTPCTYCKCVDGTAKAFPKDNCCSVNSQCTAGNGCQTPKCNVDLGTCSYTNIAGCCLANSTCAGTCRYCDTKNKVCAYYDCAAQCQSDAVCGGACKRCNTATKACYTLPYDQCCEEDSECPAPSNPCQTAGCGTNNKCYVTETPNCCYLDSQCKSGDVCQAPSCNLKTNKCILTAIQGCCKVKADCGSDPCRVCTENQCVHNYTCCSTDESCENCQRCDLTTGECVVKENCCELDAQCGACKKCTGGSCFNIPNCCASTADCETCQFCDTNDTQICQPIPGCCVLDRECGACQQCDNETRTCFNAANEECCLSDEDCDQDNCEECKDNECKGDCGAGDNTGVAIGAGIGGGIGGLLLLGGAAAAVAFGIKKHRAHIADMTRKKGDFAEGAMSNPEYEKPFSTVNSPLYNL
eukprot:TRINITY_DN3465_c0_g7_i1.p1 TRINITY_DN3465_c0_g7~~TRINITY_DN3465_c0_g7_i1.p1  ORF type:complete len:974 (+),score=216.97 TRINITY_DN3465_c0_g7_i1:470-3391(+)